MRAFLVQKTKIVHVTRALSVSFFLNVDAEGSSAEVILKEKKLLYQVEFHGHRGQLFKWQEAEKNTFFSVGGRVYRLPPNGRSPAVLPSLMGLEEKSDSFLFSKGTIFVNKAGGEDLKRFESQLFLDLKRAKTAILLSHFKM